MKNPFTALFRARDKPKDSVSAATTFTFGIAGSGKNVTARSAIQVSAVYACVRVIAETVASLPFSVFEQDKEGSQKALGHPLDTAALLQGETHTERIPVRLCGAAVGAAAGTHGFGRLCGQGQVPEHICKHHKTAGYGRA